LALDDNFKNAVAMLRPAVGLRAEVGTVIVGYTADSDTATFDLCLHHYAQEVPAG
jgi:hypothetical protein